jgi:hypothetical protein
MTAALLPVRVATREREQLALHSFRVTLGFARRDAHDQSVGSLPVRSFAPTSHQCEIVAGPRWHQFFELPCHFLCLVVVKITGTKATKKPGTCSVGRAFAWKGRYALRIVTPEARPARLACVAAARHAARDSKTPDAALAPGGSRRQTCPACEGGVGPAWLEANVLCQVRH